MLQNILVKVEKREEEASLFCVAGTINEPVHKVI